MAYLLLLVAVLAGAIGQLLLKSGMSQRPSFGFGELLTLVRDWRIVGGFAFYGTSTLLYLQALGKLDLSLAYPTASLGYVLVIILSKVLFKEPVSATRWTATGIICAGVALVGLGSV